MAVIGGIMDDLKIGKNEDAVNRAIGTGIRCAFIMLQIFIAIGGLAFLIVVGRWLIG
ncbi:hypothetical protein SAMN05421813_105149 [Daejeonella rubra]|uniref:Uncharacterized protein n=1 Tax=Daejeonella rubra TaxID=990371 RepID=A0A1G9Q758_9SPHI|nr:hypothetical protein SAMN05421813_105149 [Daejeonella rubra]